MIQQIAETSIPGCFELTLSKFKDDRGLFVKIFHEEESQKNGLVTCFAEEFYTVSRKGVLRGMHFQTPPHDLIKVVFCVSGSVLDAVVDLRVGSPTYGKYATFELNAERANMLYIPSGLAHGFYATSEAATMVYKVTAVHAPDHDAGILWSSAGIPWPDRNPIISKRDSSFPGLQEYISPFVFKEPKKP
jgi:dTDP-4-dehydrorhamnose 3,5-epimerase